MRLELDRVSLTYRQGTPFETAALSGVSLTVEPGERVGIVGPVGSGKSTLLEVLAGILPPADGRVIHNGRALGRRRCPDPGGIGLAFQSPESCLFEKSVFDDVAFAPRRLGLDEAAVRRRVTGSLENVGLDAGRFGPRSPFSLSAGEQRRVALAGVLALEPGALLLDEPTAYLDPATRHDLTGRLVSLSRNSGITVVIAGHDMDEMAQFAGRLVILDKGRKVADGPAAKLLADMELLSRHGLEAPATVRLCRLLEEKTGRQAPPALSEDGAVAALLQAAGRR